ncbi:MAG: hypothetical protein AAGK66_08300 [Pseudomonadota bacterium]
MTKSAITIERVLDLIAAYGAHPAAWPDHEREAAEALLIAKPEAFEPALQEAVELDQMLMQDDQVPEPPAHLATTIIEGAPVAQKSAQRQSWLRSLFPMGLRLPTGAAIASLGIGLMAGYSYAGDTGFDAYLESDVTYTDTLDASFDDWLGDPEGGL